MGLLRGHSFVNGSWNIKQIECTSGFSIFGAFLSYTVIWISVGWKRPFWWKKNATRRVICSKIFKFKVLERGKNWPPYVTPCTETAVNPTSINKIFGVCGYILCGMHFLTTFLVYQQVWRMKDIIYAIKYICIVCLNLPWSFPYTFCRIFYCVRSMLIHNIMSFDVPSAQRTTIPICSRHQWLDDSLRILPLHFM